MPMSTVAAHEQSLGNIHVATAAHSTLAPHLARHTEKGCSAQLDVLCMAPVVLQPVLVGRQRP
eukprot:m.1065356 g.1065356  ORF g.1065356 m.1065356 type:complete len:63 (+) comp24220_c0_seq2:109-297(+)